MAGVPNNFLTSAPIVKSYDFVDFAAGAGYKRYYGLVSALSGSALLATGLSGQATYFLSPQLEGNPTSMRKATSPSSGLSGSAWTNITSVDFDLIFNNAVVLNGNVAASLTHDLIFDSGTSGIGAFVYPQLTYSRIDTSSGVHAITSVDGGTRISNSGTKSYREMLVATLTRTQFAVGEKLRVNVKLRGKVDGDGKYHTVLYHDSGNVLTPPTDSDSYANDSDIIFDVPFKLE